MIPQSAPQSPTLFETGPEIPSCDRCQNLGLWLEPNGSVSSCPVIQVGGRHPQPNAAAVALRRATDSLKFRKIAVNPLAFAIAADLTAARSATPRSRETLLDRHFSWAITNRLRKFAAVIEELRSVWLMPIGSRKNEPSGYWIITDADDFKAWFDRARSAPITQLSWIHRVAKANFPVFAEQMEFEFWNDIEAADQAVSKGSAAKVV